MDRKIVENLKIGGTKAVGYGIWLVILLLSLSVARNLAKVINIRGEVTKEKEKVAKMEKINNDLENQIANTQGVDFVEKQIRNKLGLVKSGEALVILPDEDIVKRLAPIIDDQDDTLPDPNWKKWEKLFF
jgi:cell division protein FtsB